MQRRLKKFDEIDISCMTQKFSFMFWIHKKLPITDLWLFSLIFELTSPVWSSSYLNIKFYYVKSVLINLHTKKLDVIYEYNLCSRCSDRNFHWQVKEFCSNGVFWNFSNDFLKILELCIAFFQIVGFPGTCGTRVQTPCSDVIISRVWFIQPWKYRGSVRGVQGVKLTPRFLKKTKLHP